MKKFYRLEKSVLRRSAGVALAALFISGMSGAAWAEAKEVRFADQPGLLYLPMHVVINNKLVEKHAQKAGLGDVKVANIRLSGGAAINDALISGNIDFVIGGVVPLLKIWDKTKGNLDVKAAISISDMALVFITNDPRVKTIKDWDGITDHKIGLPAVKTSIQAGALQMAAEKTFGAGKATHLDSLTVSIPHPQAAAALIGGKSEVRTHGATLPFSYEEMKHKDKGMHVVFSSFDLLGPHTTVAMYNTKKWKEANPKLFKAVYDAYVEGIAWINADTKAAARLYQEFNKSRQDLGEIAAMIEDKSQVRYSPAPSGLMKFADFLHKTGQLANKPASWKDMFWEAAHGGNGS